MPEPAYDAQANREITALGLSEGTEIGALQAGLGNLESRTTFNETERQRAEPGQYARNEQRANAGGILESGVNAARKGTLAANFAAQRIRSQLGLLEGKNTEKSNEEKVRNAGTERRANITNAWESREQAKAARERAERAEAAAAAPPPGITVAGGGPPGSSVTSGPGSPGNPIKAGFGTGLAGWKGNVRVGPGEQIPTVIRQFAQRRTKARL